jgi:hypothetical protein
MAPAALTVQFLSWVADRPRNYADTMEAWHTTCPRLTVWEDAVSDGLICLESRGTMRDAKVLLTARGRKLLNGHGTA